MCVLFKSRMQDDEMKKIMEERRREKEEEKQARLELQNWAVLEDLIVPSCILKQFS